ncbi:MAG: hypothetical protein HQ513_17315 [Rhodospirillales bacterium]|nr:hypothetical protein [Rhodospirillales bacterium]
MADHIQIGDISPRIQYAGDGVQTVFTYPFPIFIDANIDVYEDTGLKTITTHYTVAGAGSSTGGTVTFITAPASGVVVTLLRNIAVERTSDFQESGEFRAKVINDELDKLTATQQQIETDQDRSLRLGPTDSTTSTIIPDKATRLGKVLAFDPVTGDPVVSSEDLSAIEGAATSAAAAAVSATAAAADAVAADADATAAAASAALALGATTGKYDTHIAIAFADSPYTVASLTADTLITVTTSGGNVVINLPAASGESDSRLLGINKNGATNTITINPNGADTIGGAASFVQYDDTEWADLYLDKANTDWQLGNLSFTAAGTGLSKTGSTISLKGGVSIDADGNLSGQGASQNAQTGTTFTVTGVDNGKIVYLNNAAAITVTIPQTSTETIAAGFWCTFVQEGAGQVTIAKEGTDTINSKDALLALTGQHSLATIHKRVAGSPNTWFLAGDLA